MEREKIHVILNEDYTTSYCNERVHFPKGSKVWDYKDEIFDHNGQQMILAKDEVFGHIQGFVPLSKVTILL